jgi:alanine dehydrogenase
MKTYNADAIDRTLVMADLIEALKSAFASTWHGAPRAIISAPGGAGDRLLLSMSAFDEIGAGMVKLATVFPDNASKAKPTIQGAIVVFDADGSAVAVMDGAAITSRRTAAASALASSYLSRPAASRLLVIGAGALAPFLAEAHALVRPIRDIAVLARSADSAKTACDRIRARVSSDVCVRIAGGRSVEVSHADIICCATSAEHPILKGAELSAGAHVDLVGSFKPNRRETDDATILRASVYVDTFEGAFTEAGDILIPLRRGVISRDHIRGDLGALVRGEQPGRSGGAEITVFKSVGAAIEDLAAARLVIDTMAARAR